jgi:hypothetical protein
MSKYTVNKPFRISETQAKTLNILSDRGINVSQFIRIAIKEKITKDYAKLQPKEPKEFCPF